MGFWSPMTSIFVRGVETRNMIYYQIVYGNNDVNQFNTHLLFEKIFLGDLTPRLLAPCIEDHGAFLFTSWPRPSGNQSEMIPKSHGFPASPRSSLGVYHLRGLFPLWPRADFAAAGWGRPTWGPWHHGPGCFGRSRAHNKPQKTHRNNTECKVNLG